MNDALLFRGKPAGELLGKLDVYPSINTGGSIVSGAQHPSFTTAEALYQKLPDESFFSPIVAPTRPIQFEIGAFKVPRDAVFWVTDYEFFVMLPSGVDPHDSVQAAEGRFGGMLGFDITINSTRASRLYYELDPSPIVLGREAFAGGGPVQPGTFNRAAFNSFASTAGPGTSLLPLRPEVQGPRQGPFLLVAQPDVRVALGCVIFWPITSPIHSIGGRVAGYLVSERVSTGLLDQMRPNV